MWDSPDPGSGTYPLKLLREVNLRQRGDGTGTKVSARQPPHSLSKRLGTTYSWRGSGQPPTWAAPTTSHLPKISRGAGSRLESPARAPAPVRGGPGSPSISHLMSRIPPTSSDHPCPLGLTSRESGVTTAGREPPKRGRSPSRQGGAMNPVRSHHRWLLLALGLPPALYFFFLPFHPFFWEGRRDQDDAALRQILVLSLPRRHLRFFHLHVGGDARAPELARGVGSPGRLQGFPTSSTESGGAGAAPS